MKAATFDQSAALPVAGRKIRGYERRRRVRSAAGMKKTATFRDQSEALPVAATKRFAGKKGAAGMNAAGMNAATGLIRARRHQLRARKDSQV